MGPEPHAGCGSGEVLNPQWQRNTVRIGRLTSPGTCLIVTNMADATREIPRGSVVVVTGIMGAGKSTVAELLARRLPTSVHVRGDAFRRAIVRGRVDMTPDADDEALRQLHLRYELGAMVADRYATAGFTALYQDIIVGDQLPATVERIRSRPLYVVALTPRAEVAGRRAEDRDKVSGYGAWTPEALDALLRATPRIGLWLDTSDQSASETVDEIIRRAEEARVG